MADDKGCWPIQSRMGIDVMSINLLVENEEDPSSGAAPSSPVRSSSSGLMWSGKMLIFLFVDMPPGTVTSP